MNPRLLRELKQLLSNRYSPAIEVRHQLNFRSFLIYGRVPTIAD